jgi:DNA ligase-1
MKPMLASDFDQNKVTYPVYLQPKCDGVRGLYLNEQFTGRSLKTHKNKNLTAFYSQACFKGIDGELFVGDNPAAQDLCRKTSSVCSTVDSKEIPSLMVFDYITEYSAPYKVRFERAGDKVFELQDKFPYHNIQLVRSVHVSTASLLAHYEQEWLAEGFEGLIIRHPFAAYKEGRSTVKEGGLLRIKRFTDAEALVTGITEGVTNMNEAKTNQRGLTERSSHQGNKVPNGTVGNLLCKDLATKAEITVGPGNMTHDLRKHYFQNQNELVGKVIKYKSFVHGVKDKPRFPTFICIRDAEDMPQ